MPQLRTALVVGLSPTEADLATKGLGPVSWRIVATTSEADPNRLPINLAEDHSVRTAIATLIELTTRLDVIIFCSIPSEATLLDSSSTAPLSNALSSNIVGLHRIILAALPHLRPSLSKIMVIDRGSFGGEMDHVSSNALRAYVNTMAFALNERKIAVSFCQTLSSLRKQRQDTNNPGALASEVIRLLTAPSPFEYG